MACSQYGTPLTSSQASTLGERLFEAPVDTYPLARRPRHKTPAQSLKTLLAANRTTALSEAHSMAAVLREVEKSPRPSEYACNEQQYERVKKFLETKQLKRRFRLYFNPSTSILQIQMPQAIHEMIAAVAVMHIYTQLKTIANGTGQFAELARNIGPRGSSDLEFWDYSGEKPGHWNASPDASFEHINCRFPGLVIEVSNSQKVKKVVRKAQEYIINSDGAIQTVLLFDLDYNKGKGGRAAIWTAQTVIENGQNTLVPREALPWVMFRSPNGDEVNAGRSLQIPLGYFLPNNVRDFGIEEGPVISVPFSELYQEAATGQQVKGKRKRASSPKPPERRTRFRFPTPTSSDSNASDTESEDSAIEEKVMKQCDKGDRSYKLSSSRQPPEQGQQRRLRSSKQPSRS